MFTFLAILALGALATWWFGSIALRVVGVFLIFGTLISLVTVGDPIVVLMLPVGVLAWLAGHWLFAYKHHVYRSTLAQRIFLNYLPARLDPTRGWGVPTVDVSRHYDE